jgi:hypothetical protein
MRHVPGSLFYLAFASVFSNAFSAWAQSNEAKLFLAGPTQVAVSKPIVISNDGVTDAEGDFYAWPAIVDAQLLGEQTEAFQQAREMVGEPLFRIDHRLRMAEWTGLEQLANGLTTLEFSEASGNLARVKLAALHGCLHSQQNEAAASHLLNLYGVPRLNEVAREYPKLMTSPDELQTGFCESLMPLFFDRATAVNLVVKNKSTWLRQSPEWRWGSQLYFAALLLAAEEFQEAQAAIDKWDDSASPELREWKQVLDAQIEIANGRFGVQAIALERQLPKLNGPAKLCAQYCLAQAYVMRAKSESQHRQALLCLLEVVAVNRHRHHQLAAGALNQAIILANDHGWEFERNRLKTELLKNYPETYHGRQVLRERNE